MQSIEDLFQERIRPISILVISVDLNERRVFKNSTLKQYYRKNHHGEWDKKVN